MFDIFHKKKNRRKNNKNNNKQATFYKRNQTLINVAYMRKMCADSFGYINKRSSDGIVADICTYLKGIGN